MSVEDWHNKTIIRPIADGPVLQWTPLSGGFHYVEVDDSPSHDGDVSKIYMNGTMKQDDFDIQTMIQGTDPPPDPVDIIISAVRVNVWCKKSGISTPADFIQTTIVLSTINDGWTENYIWNPIIYTLYTREWTTKQTGPFTWGPITRADVEAMILPINGIVSGRSISQHCTMIEVEVNWYLPPVGGYGRNSWTPCSRNGYQLFVGYF